MWHSEISKNEKGRFIVEIPKDYAEHMELKVGDKVAFGIITAPNNSKYKILTMEKGELRIKEMQKLYEDARKL